MSSKDSLTIFLITNNYRPYSSGVTNSLESLHTQLHAFGHRSFVVTLDFLGQQRPEDGVIRLYCPIRFTYKKNYMAVPLRPKKELTLLIEKFKPDILHVHHPFLLGRVGLRLARHHKLPIVFTYHTQYEQYLHYLPVSKRVSRPVVKQLVTYFCRNVDGIIAPSATIKNELATRTITTPTAVIPSSIGKPFFAKRLEKKLAKPIHLVSVSRFAKEKNVEFLLRVMRRLVNQDATMTLVGYGVHEKALKTYAYGTLGLSNHHVTFVVNPTQQELAAWYKKATLFVFASQTETQGLVLAEAMAAGTPVVALDACGSRDVVQDGRNGRLVESEAEMVRAIEQLTSNQDHYRNYCQHAMQTAQNYRPGVLTEQMVGFYRRMLTYRSLR